MAITFLQQRKKQRYLTSILLVITAIIGVVVWQGFFTPEKEIIPDVPKPPQKLEINLEILANPLLNQLQPIEPIRPIDREIELGRDNPFIPF